LSWIPDYGNEVWEPVWAAAAACELPLVTHVGGGGDTEYVGMTGKAVAPFECGAPVFGLRALPWLIFAGVFERFPGLKLVVTEIMGIWWTQLMTQLDSLHRQMVNPWMQSGGLAE